MKPGFALLFSQDTIGLMQRSAEGWDSLGEAAVAAPDLGPRLYALREAAAGRTEGTVTSKLVIPASEILYITVTAPGPSAASRRAQVRAALEGRTPYAVKELAFDWRGTGPEVQVAVVARETLAEAEAFAEEHGFGPMSFVASPDPSHFPGEPWFGAASGADKRLKPGEKVERDPDPVVWPVPESESGPESALESLPESAREAMTETDAPFEALAPSDLVAPDSDRLEAAVAKAVAAEAAVVAEDAPDASVARRVDPSEDVQQPSDLSDLEPESALPDRPSSAPRDISREPQDHVPQTAQPHDFPSEPEQAPAPLSPEIDDLPAPALTSAESLSPPEDLVPPPLKRTSGVDVLSPALDMPPDLMPDAASAAKGGAAPAIARLKAKLAESAGDGRSNNGRRPTPGAPPPLGAEGGAASRAQKPPARAEGTGPRLSVVAQDGRVARPAPNVRPAIKGSSRTNVSMVTAPGIPLPRDRRVNIPAADGETEARVRGEAEARKAARPEGDKRDAFGTSRPVRRGKPRFLGLILTGVLLLLLAVVAAWSSFYLASNEDPDPVQVAAAPDPGEPPAPTPEAAPAPDDEMAADLQIAPDAATGSEAGIEAGTEIATQPGTPAETLAETLAEQSAEALADAGPQAPAAGLADTLNAAAPEPVVMTGPDAAAVAADGTSTLSTSGNLVETVDAAVVAPPVTEPGAVRTPNEEPQDEIFLARSDPSVPTAAPVALSPPVATADAPPAAQPLPPPFGTVYQFDAQGRIVPTPEGIVTPDGVRLVAGRPPVVPPERPAAAVLAADAPVADAVAAEAPAAEAPASDVLAAAPTAPNATASEAAAASVAGVLPAPADSAAVAADPALADARPRARPEALAPAPQTEAAPATADDDASLPESEVTTGDTRVTSPRPLQRPASVLAAGEAAQAATDAAATAAATSLASLAAAAVDPDASPLAVAVSRKPAARPRDFSAAVDAAVAEAVRAPAPEAVPQPAPEPTRKTAAVAPEQAAPATIAMAMPAPKVEPAPKPKVVPAPEPTALPAPEAEPEPRAGSRKSRSDDPAEVEADDPEVEKAAPSTGNRSTVAKQATYRNAINLSKTNLIGVYGSSSKRYALVRQPNGRYVKVSVGDRVDGGRVAAISDRELSYVKNGRTVTLKMPKS